MKLFKRKDKPMPKQEEIVFHEPSPIWLKMREEAKNRTPEEREEMERKLLERIDQLGERNKNKT